MTDWKYIGKTSEGKIIYKIIYSAIFSKAAKGLEILKIKARLAGLEPATPCLEGRFKGIVRISEFLKQNRSFVFM